MSPTVRFLSSDSSSAKREVTLDGRHSLLTFARMAGVSVPSVCGGHGECGKCRLKVVEGVTGAPDPVESRLLGQEDLAEGWRLSCQVFVVGDVTVAAPADRNTTVAGKGSTPAFVVRGDQDPAIVAVPLPVDVEDGPACVDERTLLSGLGLHAGSVTLSAQRDLAEIWHRDAVDGGGRTSWAVVRGHSVVEVMLRRDRPQLLGVAVDVGTTTLAAYLVDLETGEELAATAAPNEQASFGCDVMSRADWSIHGHGAELRDAVVSGINGLIEQLCAAVGRSPAEIYEAAVGGNSCMHHLLLGLPVDHLAKAPYVPVSRRSLTLPAAEVGINLNPAAVVYCFPLIGGFVGGDIVAGLLATRLYESDAPRLFFDFGTNAEIVLGSRDGMVACSTAAGPAFEGGRIRFGMRATTGAITAVDLVGGRLRVSTVDGAEAAGIAGSGLVDAVAVLRREGIIDGAGLLTDHPAVGDGDRCRQVIIAPPSESASGVAISLTQEDIVEFQLARAAVRAGAEVLFRELAVDSGDVAEVLVAGAFGSALCLENALSIGLIPPVSAGVVTSAGNTAGAGAKMGLISLAQRRVAARLSAAVRYVELAGRPDFADAFARHLLFE